jgi:selenide,water dikinase
MVDPNLLVGVETGDDAAVYKLDAEHGLIFTVDFFPPVVDDPFHYGAVAAANSMSDVYAMGGKPLMALNIVGFPINLSKDVLSEILRGGYTKAQEAGCIIAGGHTVDDAEPKYGLAVIGLVPPGKQVTNAGAKPGDQLVLTKPLGTGVITTAGKQGVAGREVMDEAVRWMETLNARAAEAMMAVGVNACTDITGFGLAGHLKGMMAWSGTLARIYLSRVPAISGVWRLIEQGVAPGGTHRNLKSLKDWVKWHRDITVAQKIFLADAQTSGGLLISVAESKTDALVRELGSRGVETAAVIGEVVSRDGAAIEVAP